MYAVQGQNYKIAEECLNNFANPFVKDYLGKDVLAYALVHKEKKCGNIYRLVEKTQVVWK